MEKENTTGTKMALQLAEYTPISLKRKVNQRCYFSTFFLYKKVVYLSLIKVGCYILKEGRKIPTTEHFRRSNFSNVISQLFS